MCARVATVAGRGVAGEAAICPKCGHDIWPSEFPPCYCSPGDLCGDDDYDDLTDVPEHNKSHEDFAVLIVLLRDLHFKMCCFSVATR